MKNAVVANLHAALRALGGSLPDTETSKSYYGTGTAKRVAVLQKAAGLEQTGEVDNATADHLNRKLAERGLLGDAPPRRDSGVSGGGTRLPGGGGTTRRPPFFGGGGGRNGNTGQPEPVHVFGRVISQKGRPEQGVVTIFRAAFRAEEKLVEVETDQEGRYEADLTHDPATGPLNILARITLKDGTTIASDLVFDAAGKVELNLNAAGRPIPAQSAFEEIEANIRPVIGSAAIASLRETATQTDITYLAQDRKLDPEILSRRAMAERIGKAQKIAPEVVFAFLAQGEPAVLPGSTLTATPTQVAADDLESRVFAGIVTLDEQTQRRILQKAIDKDLVPFDTTGAVDAAIEILRARRGPVLADAPFGAGKKSMNDLLGATSLTQNQRTTFVDYAMKVQDEGGLLWEALEMNKAIPAAKLRDARATFAFGAMSKNHIPFIEYAKAALPDEMTEEPGRAAALSLQEWKTFLEKGVSEGKPVIPVNIDGQTEADRVGAFAQMLMERAEDNYPTMATIGRIRDRDDVKLAAAGELVAAVSKVPDMNLRTLNINAVRLGRDAALGEEMLARTLRDTVKIVSDLSDEAVADLKRTQRAVRLAPNATAAAALLATGQDSAHLIHKRGRSNFIADAVKAGMTDLQAGQTFNRAKASYGYLIARFLEYRLDLDKASPAAVGGAWKGDDLIAEIENDPSLRTLFGSLDSCSCEWCESVHGPAAYLTDVLRWLSERRARSGSGFASARAVLEDRRGDIPDILLNCQNTDTVMPYIDLVNEVLEEAVSPTGSARQSTWRSEELMAEPEHVNDDAYALLAGASHAPGLPFDLSDTEARTYLAHLRLTRAGVMEAFRMQSISLPSERDIAAAFFGIAKAQSNIITSEAPGAQATFWGYSAPGEMIPSAPAQMLMARADISYTDLAELLEVEFVNGIAPRSTFQPEFECDLIDRRVTRLSVERLDRMNRFIRLWRHLGWKMWELDRAIMAMGGVLNDATLVGLMRLQKIRDAWRLSVQEALALIAPLDTRVRGWLTGDGRSLYTDLFEDPAVQNPPDPHLSIAAVTAALPPALIGDKAAILSASIAITAADFALLVPRAADPVIALPVAGDRASLGAISQLYRFARLAKALRLRVSELLDFARLAGAPLNAGGRVDPFQTVQTLTDFLTMFSRHSASGLAIGESRHATTFWPESAFGAGDSVISANVEEIRTALADLRAETIAPAEERAAALERQLPGVAGFEDAAIRATAIAIIDDSYADSLANRNAFITSHFGALMPMAAAIAAFAPYGGPPAGRDAAVDARRLIALQAVYNALARTAITAAVAGQNGAEAEAADFLSWTMQRSGLDSLAALILAESDFLTRTADDSAYLLAADSTDMPDIFEAAQLVDKLAFIKDALGWSDARLRWFVSNEGSFGLPQLTALPVKAGDGPAAFAEWLTLLRWTQVMNSFPDTDALSLPDILGQVGSAGYGATQLAEDLALWTRRAPETVSGAIVELALSNPGDFHTVGAYERLLTALEVIKLAGVTPAQLTAWAQPAVTPAVAQGIKLAAKARNSLDEWLKNAPPLQDRLREAKRVALITYLTTRPASAGPSWPDANALFAHFLIDPEMTACRKTSRLVQATGSVQLFVQRCLMNLEPAVLADGDADDGWNDWDWMYAYRLWEAARKVFLWPENVIRPELNRMKSPALLQLEQKLSQMEMTEENAEIAMEQYLETLDGIANMDVVALHEESTGRDRLIHTLARTKGQPQTYYYRQRVFPNNAASAYWTPWEKLDIEIGGIPIFGFINRKLHLFWLFFTKKDDPTQLMPPSTASSDPPPDTINMWEIQLCWSVRRQGIWQPAQMGERKWFYPQYRPKRSFHLRTAAYAGDRLAINIFVSTSPEFNDYLPLTYLEGLGTHRWPRDWVDVTPLFLPIPIPIPHNEDTRPFHIARFVFKRDVDEIQMTNRAGFLTRILNGEYGAEAAEMKELTSPLTDLTMPTDMKYVGQTIQNQSDNASNLHVLPSTGPALRLDSGKLLDNAPAPFGIVTSSQRAQFDSTRPFFYTDRERSFFVRPTKEWRVDHSFTTEEPSLSGVSDYRVKYTFDRNYHPFTGFFLDELATGGLRGFFRRSTQLSPPSTFAFADYAPERLVTADHANDIVDFGFSGTYSLYNWEVLFHAPFLIANRLSENQRFDEALNFLRYIFNPTNAGSDLAPQRFWITKPFYQMSSAAYKGSRIERLLELVNGGSATHIAQVEQWRNDPFDPHMLARLRPVAYQRAVLMAYIGALLDWGDKEFRRFTPESLNLATQYYVRAQDLLGRRPETVAVERRTAAKSFREVETDLDAFGNLLSEVENLLPPPPPGGPGGSEPLPPTTIFYFCIPGNDKLLGYWDRVERNLFNLRHCRDIEGVARPLPLFAPPIDPAMLVRAAAAGIDLSTLAGGAASAMPKYRFRFILQRAYNFATQVERLGAALLSALERKDEAALAELRESHVAEIHALREDIAALRIDEAEAELDRLKEAKKLVGLRETFYKKKTETPVGVLEGIGLGLKSTSFVLSGISFALKAASGGLYWIPEVQGGASGVGGSPHATVKVGGKQAGDSTKTLSDGFKVLADLADKGAELSFKIQYFFDRHKEYEHQLTLAEQEIVEIEKQEAKAEILKQIAEREADVEKLHSENAEATLGFLRSRYTNKELYDWLIAQLSTVYFQTYQTAFDMALAAAACAEREVGLIGMNYIKFGYWDSLRKGLMSGEKLSQDLRRLEAAYIDRNQRLYEIQKDVSVALLDAEALLTLRATGACEIEVPELIFDCDYPGHYKRRIKSVAISIPTVAGPYTSVNCKLTLLRDETRLNTNLAPGYPRTSMADDERFADNWAVTNAIVTSKAINDPGLFQLDLEDDRYLPFEGAGAVGRWRIDLPADTNAFAIDSVSDVVLHLRYTAMEGGETLAEAARAVASQRPVAQSARILRLDQTFAAAWEVLVSAPAAGLDQAMTFAFTKEHLPYLDRVRDLKVTSILLSAVNAVSDLTAEITAPGGIVATVMMTPDGDLGGRISGDTAGIFAAGVPLSDFTLKLRRSSATDNRSLTKADLSGLHAVIFYDAELP
ncbi:MULTISPECIES: neuraminidase-like domain-containing protein [Aphanothece]|uniref:Tc toxin subunit A-related protein n=1 Tax=Aphanothece TaxID=1121 RepID=UPI00398480E8